MRGDKKEKKGLVRGYLTGAFAACISKTISSPFLSYSSLLQSRKYNPVGQQEINIVKDMKRDPIGCVRGLWRGNVKRCRYYYPHQALNFGINEVIYVTLSRFPSLHSLPFHSLFLLHFSGGAATGWASLALVYHYHTALSMLCLTSDGRKQFTGILDVYKKTIKREGIRRLYKGMGIQAIGVSVYRGMYFGVYHSYRHSPLPTPSFLSSLSIAFPSSLAAFFVSYPFDSVRKAVLLNPHLGSFSQGAKFVLNQGPSAFFKGFFNFMVTGRWVTGILTLAIYDYAKCLSAL